MIAAFGAFQGLECDLLVRLFGRQSLRAGQAGRLLRHQERPVPPGPHAGLRGTLSPRRRRPSTADSAGSLTSARRNTASSASRRVPGRSPRIGSEWTPEWSLLHGIGLDLKATKATGAGEAVALDQDLPLRHGSASLGCLAAGGRLFHGGYTPDQGLHGVHPRTHLQPRQCRPGHRLDPAGLGNRHDDGHRGQGIRRARAGSSSRPRDWSRTREPSFRLWRANASPWATDGAKRPCSARASRRKIVHPGARGSGHGLSPGPRPANGGGPSSRPIATAARSSPSARNTGPSGTRWKSVESPEDHLADFIKELTWPGVSACGSSWLSSPRRGRRGPPSRVSRRSWRSRGTRGKARAAGWA